MKNRVRPLIILFILLNGVFLAVKSLMTKYNVDYEVLVVGNLVVFAATVLSFWVSARSFLSPNPNAFIGAMYKSFMIKFFICLVAAFAYIMVVKKNVNKPGLIISMGLYIVYTFIEVSILTRILKEKKNA